jgi:hypothetical protein
MMISIHTHSLQKMEFIGDNNGEAKEDKLALP